MKSPIEMAKKSGRSMLLQLYVLKYKILCPLQIHAEAPPTLASACSGGPGAAAAALGAGAAGTGAGGGGWRWRCCLRCSCSLLLLAPLLLAAAATGVAAVDCRTDTSCC
jgi:hypothetical protein